MKKKIFGSFATLSVIVVMALNVNLNTYKSDTNSFMALANVEALASGESGGVGRNCYNNYAPGGVSFFYECQSCQLLWFMSGGWNAGNCL
jgi:hypothetical protein